MNFADRLNEAAKYNSKKEESVFTASELREANNKLIGAFLVTNTPEMDAASKFMVSSLMTTYMELLIKFMKGEDPNE